MKNWIKKRAGKLFFCWDCLSFSPLVWVCGRDNAATKSAIIRGGFPPTVSSIRSLRCRRTFVFGRNLPDAAR